MNRAAILTAALTLGCTTVIEQPISLRPCDPTSSTGETITTSSGSESSSTGDLDCPTIVDGNVEFCVDAACRNVFFDGISEATGSGPAVLAWRGTYETVAALLVNNPGADMRAMALAEGGVIAVPESDPDAFADAEPFPWLDICGPFGTMCTRTDDYEIASLIATCVLDQGLADPSRVVAGGLSAGGIMSSDLLAYGLGDITLAAITSWSGGRAVQYQSEATVPASLSTSVFSLHGGMGDIYCGAGQPTTGCYSFSGPAEQLANDVANAGGFAFVCNHGGGHVGSMGGQGAEFLAVARANAPHPWIGFPFGVTGNNGWSQMSGGTNWMLRNYGDCHAPVVP